MDVVVSRCAGIDIGKSEVVVCLRVPGSDGERVSEVRTFTAFTGEVERLADWLAEAQVSHVVMEASGQYWKPVWDVLAQRGFELMLVNAPHVKMVGVRLARFAAREQRCGCAAGVVRVGGAAAGFAGGDGSCSSRFGLLMVTARWSCRSLGSSPSWRRVGGLRRRRRPRHPTRRTTTTRGLRGRPSESGERCPWPPHARHR
jgi:Transposase